MLPSLHKMEVMLKQVVRQSEELYGVFRQLESESRGGKAGEERLPGAQALGARLARWGLHLLAPPLAPPPCTTSLLHLLAPPLAHRYQGSLVALEKQATDLMEEIRETHTR